MYLKGTVKDASSSKKGFSFAKSRIFTMLICFFETNSGCFGIGKKDKWAFSVLVKTQFVKQIVLNKLGCKLNINQLNFASLFHKEDLQLNRNQIFLMF